MTEITIPGNVKEIGVDVFAGCDNLKYVKMPKDLLESVDWTFNNDVSKNYYY